MARNKLLTALVGKQDDHQYQAISSNEAGGSQDPESTPRRPSLQRRPTTVIVTDIKRRLFIVTTAIVVVVLLIYLIVVTSYKTATSLCDSVDTGFQCQPDSSHHWGQYSPYFSVPSEISPEIPLQCEVTFAQVLSRHGARDPTFWATVAYVALIAYIHEHTEAYSSEYSFLEDYEVTLGQDQLTTLGEQELVNSGIKFYKRYQSLAKDTTPFFRSAGQHRVVQSAVNFTQGFHLARSNDRSSAVEDSYPYPILAIPEGNDQNNTLSIDLCRAFDVRNEIEAKAAWESVFLPSITSRINDHLKGANFSFTQTIQLMDLCPYNTVASSKGSISKFCGLFTDEEWKDYDYFQSLGKYYGYSWGNPLAPPQGVGWTNELIARLTRTPVHDHTSTNSTLDADPETFPLGEKLYADFSHDNDMMMIFSALGLFNSTRPLETGRRMSKDEMKGFSAAAAVPFASRMYVEKLRCVRAEEGEKEEEWVRVLVNDQVMELKTCGGDEFGRCRLGAFVESLGYARGGGDWEKCFL